MASSNGRIAHHDVCFGCGLANPFGLQLELEEGPSRELRGRFFVKQDHQGTGGEAHDGLLAAALLEAMALAVERRGAAGALRRFELEARGSAPVGTYVEVRARAEGAEAGEQAASAELRDAAGEALGSARAVFREPNVPG